MRALTEPSGGCWFAPSLSWVVLSRMRREGWLATFRSGAGYRQSAPGIGPARFADVCVREAMTKSAIRPGLASQPDIEPGNRR